MGKRILCVILAFLLLMPVGLPSVSAAQDKVVIVLDPGHGGVDSGTAKKYDGKEVWESTLNLAIANACRDFLVTNYENVEVHLTRESNKKVSLDERVNFAEQHKADYMLSIHINSANGKARGALAIVPRGKYNPIQGKASLRTAEAILDKMEELGMRLVDTGTTYQLATSWAERYPDGTYVDSFAVIRGCVRRNIPCIIMEHGFLDNESDYREFLSTPDKLAALGEADALGLAETLGLVEKKTPLPFADVTEGDWFHDAVYYAWEQGLMDGVSDTEFAPGTSANRAMVVTLLYRLHEADTEPHTCSFDDVDPGSWYHAPVEWALANGITDGISDTEFAPNRNVTREQFVTFLNRYAGEPEPDALPEDLPDWTDVSGYAQMAVAWAVETGLLTGYEDGTIKPQRELSRAELATLMQRFHEWFLSDWEEEEEEEEVPKVTWTISHTDVTIDVGEAFTLTLRSSDGQKASVTWKASKSGYVTISGNKITGKAKGTVTVSCEHEGQTYSCIVRVKKS